MTDNTDDKAMSVATGMLSLEYLNLLYPGNAGSNADGVVSSPVQWALNVQLGRERPADDRGRVLSVRAGGAELSRPGTEDRKRAARRAAKKPTAGTPPIELSEREKSCLSWTALGKSSWEIGQILRISENTVIFHIKNAMKKLGVSSRTLAAVKAVEMGLIELTISREAQV